MARVDTYVTPCLVQIGDASHRGVCATCRRCGHEQNMATPTSSRKPKKDDILAVLQLLQDTCPRGEYHRYLRSPLPPGITLWACVAEDKEIRAWVDNTDVVTACGVVPSSVVIKVKRTDPADAANVAAVLGTLRTWGYRAEDGGEGPPWPSHAPERQKEGV